MGRRSAASASLVVFILRRSFSTRESFLRRSGRHVTVSTQDNALRDSTRARVAVLGPAWQY